LVGFSGAAKVLLPFTAFPDSFQADIAAYRDRLAGEDPEALFGIANADDPFEPPVAVKPQSPMTVETKLQHIKTVANALHRTGVPLAEIASLASLVTPLVRPKAIMTRLCQEGGKKRARPVSAMRRKSCGRSRNTTSAARPPRWKRSPAGPRLPARPITA
jgi:hypothetical protein